MILEIATAISAGVAVVSLITSIIAWARRSSAEAARIKEHLRVLDQRQGQIEREMEDIRSGKRRGSRR